MEGARRLFLDRQQPEGKDILIEIKAYRNLRIALFEEQQRWSRIRHNAFQSKTGR